MPIETAVQLPRAVAAQKADVVIGRSAGLSQETIFSIFRGAAAYNTRVMTATLRQIDDEIAASRYMLALGDDWDDEGAPGYRQETWERATGFVRSTVEKFVRLTGRAAPIPRISHGPDSSVDILWDVNGRRLLVNVPDDTSRPADYYGDNGPARDFTVKGLFNPASPQTWLLLWLTE